MLARSLAAVLTAAAVAVAFASWTGGFAAPGRTVLTDNSATALVVDAELVIAVDVSNSMDPEEQALQREGYIAGLTSREFLTAVSEGANGKIAVTYFEWAGPTDQKIVLPWRLIDGPESAAAAVAVICSHSVPARATHLNFWSAPVRQRSVFQRQWLSGLTTDNRRLWRRYQ
jgi:hypothetical protein